LSADDGVSAILVAGVCTKKILEPQGGRAAKKLAKQRRRRLLRSSVRAAEHINGNLPPSRVYIKRGLSSLIDLE
jgi:hypothetical protein